MRRVVVLVWSVFVLVLSAVNADAASDVVVYVSNAPVVRGNWSRVGDASAAGGQKLSGADWGWATTGAPLAQPNDYFEVSVTVDANTSYHVWTRMRASADSKWNDSVWMQFDAATDAGGAAVYPIGSASGLLLNLEPCSNCGTTGWGWVDGAYWLGQTSTIRFATGGTHTIRVQTREDGVEVDQIVLSPASWLWSPPGQVRGDNTIVQPTPPAPGTGASPFSGRSLTMPGTIQAEEFDNGGQGIAYRDATAGNSGGQFRATDVDIEPSSNGGYNVGWMAAGEWLQYSIDLAAGSYLVEFRVACLGQGGTFHLELDGADVTGAIRIPDTGGWQSWQTLSRTVSAGARMTTARLVLDSDGTSAVGNIDWIRISAGGAGSPGSAATPYSGSPITIPGTIEVEQFDNGGESVGYHDTTSGNSGGLFRSTDVDIEAASGGGFNVGYVDAGEWLRYSVNIGSAGAYTVQFRVASAGQGAHFIWRSTEQTSAAR